MYNFETHYIEDELFDCGQKLTSGELTGIIIDDFLSLAEAASIKNAYYNTLRSKVTIVDEGFVSYPQSFAQLTQGLLAKTIEPNEFFNRAQTYKDTFQDVFGVNLLQRLQSVTERLFDGKKLYVPTPENKKGSFVPFTFRELKPGKGELKVHCENLFFNEFPYFFSLLEHIVLRKNEFSFFVVISSPDEGGELTLYNANWSSVKERENFTTLKDYNGNTIDILSPEVQSLKIKPKTGSLLIFSGGDIWHRVEIVNGAQSRITIGGFISTGVNNDDLFIWS